MDPAAALSLAVSAFRRYEGSTDAAKFLRQFDGTCKETKKNETWAVQNLDRFLDGAAKFWWLAKQESYETRLDNNEDAKIVWEAAKVEMSLFFNKDTQKEEARRLLHDTKFTVGDDPLLYVTQRCRYLALAEPHLDEKEQVSRLIQGLPDEIRLSIMYARSPTVALFTENLRDMLNHSFLGKTLTKQAARVPSRPNWHQSQSLTQYPPQAPAQPQQAQSYRPRPPPLMQNAPKNRANSAPGFLPQAQLQGLQTIQQYRTADDLPICVGCHLPGHIRRYCPTNPWPQPNPNHAQYGNGYTAPNPKQNYNPGPEN